MKRTGEKSVDHYFDSGYYEKKLLKRLQTVEAMLVYERTNNKEALQIFEERLEQLHWMNKIHFQDTQKVNPPEFVKKDDLPDYLELGEVNGAAVKDDLSDLTFEQKKELLNTYTWLQHILDFEGKMRESREDEVFGEDHES